MEKEKFVRDQTWRSRSSNGTTRRPSYLSEHHALRTSRIPRIAAFGALELGDTGRYDDFASPEVRLGLFVEIFFMLAAPPMGGKI